MKKKVLKKLENFFKTKYKKYNVYINKPYYSVLSSSMLSPYLTWGNISIKTLQKATAKHLNELESKDKFNHSQLKAFYQRIQWHCSFVQAVENNPMIDSVPFDNRFEGVRNNNHAKLAAFQNGVTGIPFVDACIIALKETGWINFKQRALLASFACNLLLLDWREVGLVLANLWLDYEPGIHWLQMQKQSGLIPKAHIPIYDALKQSKMHDPHGLFIKKYIPQLKTLDDTTVHEPWNLTINPYIQPIISYTKTLQENKKILYAIKVENKI